MSIISNFFKSLESFKMMMQKKEAIIDSPSSSVRLPK